MANTPFWFVAGAALGGLAAAAWIWPAVRAARAQAAALRATVARAQGDAAMLAALRLQLSGLRHDIRGILSPALLVSDRLLTHDEAYVRRAGEVMVRTVERASARLSESQLDQEPPTRDQQ